MPKSYYQKKPALKSSTQKQCIWVNDEGIQCKRKAVGYFFCTHHLRIATLMDQGSYSEYTVHKRKKSLRSAI